MIRVDNRIRLWRNTIQLFHKYNKPAFEGPFFQSGYRDYRIEATLLERSSGKESTPDIIARSPRGWLVIELTGNDKSKESKLDSYRNIDPRNLRNYGWAADCSEPEVISSRLSMVDDGKHCQIIVDDRLDVFKEESIKDAQLRGALRSANGKDLSRLPEIPVSLVPEMKGQEIRVGLIDLVLQLFCPACCEGKSDYNLCIEGLERLAGNVSPGAKHALQDKVKAEMAVLVKNQLAGYLEIKDGRYRATDKLKEHPRARELVAKKLRDWAYPPDRTLSDYKIE
jgi:hypothetical protein